MTSATWERVHVGDVVRGADQRPWAIVGRDTERYWIGQGREARFYLEAGYGCDADARRVMTWQRLAAPVELVRRADHTGLERAAGALISNGIGVRILSDTQLQQPTQEVKRDRWGRYLLPDPATGAERAWTRVTTIARVLADEYNLGQWAERMVAKGMAMRPDLVAGAAAADLDRDKGTLQGIAQQAKDAAGGKSGANLGTALHSFTERLDRGEAFGSLGAPPPLDKDLRAYGQALNEAGLRIDPAFIERIVITPELGVAGTLDRGAYLPGVDGVLTIVDLKTAKSVEYSFMEIAIQLAIYSRATHAWNAAHGTWQPMPPANLATALVVHLPVGKAAAQVYEIDLVEGWRLAQVAADVKAARGKAKKLARPAVAKVDVPAEAFKALEVSTPDDVLKLITRAESQQRLAAIWDMAQPRGLWTAEVHAYAQARLRQLTAAPQA